MEPFDRAALLIIDMQRGMASERAGPRNNPQAEQNISQLLSLWRRRHLGLVHIRHISRDPESLFWPGQQGVEFQDNFAPLPEEHVVEKNVPDALINTGLERWLRVRGLSQLVIAGVSTNNSVEATARTAGNLGFEVYVVEDATFTFDMWDYRGKHRAAADLHSFSLANLSGEYAQIVATSDLSTSLMKEGIQC
ncbi:MAG: cysteine hydrolase family protein [Pseudomonadota bacterium]